MHSLAHIQSKQEGSVLLDLIIDKTIARIPELCTNQQAPYSLILLTLLHTLNVTIKHAKTPLQQRFIPSSGLWHDRWIMSPKTNVMVYDHCFSHKTMGHVLRTILGSLNLKILTILHLKSKIPYGRHVC